MINLKRAYLHLFALIALTLAVDQITKRIVVDALMVGETVRPIPALAPYFQITRIFNTGAAFGILPNAGWLFTVIAVGVVIVLIALLPRFPSRTSRIALGLVCGGALGNVVDRLLYDAVVDFIHYQIPGVISNVSNLADHAVVLGVIVLIIDSWRGDSRPKTADALPADETKMDTISVDSNRIEE
jgi:signal peptidase II